MDNIPTKPSQTPTDELPPDTDIKALKQLHDVGWGEGDHQDSCLPDDIWDNDVIWGDGNYD